MGRRPQTWHAGVHPARQPEHAGRLRAADRAGRPAHSEVHPGPERQGHPRVPAAGRRPGGQPNPADPRSRPVVPRLERRQPVPQGLERPPRPEVRRVLHQPLRRPASRRRLRAAAGRQGPLPRGRDHHRVDPGLREDVRVAGRGPGRARLRRHHLRRAGPGHQRDASSPGTAGRHPLVRPDGEARRARGERLPGCSLPADLQLRLRDRGRPRLPALDARPPLQEPGGRLGRRQRLQPALAADRQAARHANGHARPDEQGRDHRPLARRRGRLLRAGGRQAGGGRRRPRQADGR